MKLCFIELQWTLFSQTILLLSLFSSYSRSTPFIPCNNSPIPTVKDSFQCWPIPESLAQRRLQFSACLCDFESYKMWQVAELFFAEDVLQLQLRSLFFYFLSGLVLFCSACRWAEIDKRRGGAWIRIRIRGSAALFGARCKCLDKGSDLCGSSWELLGGAAGDDNSSSNPLNAASHSPYPIPGWAKSEVPAI